MMHSLSLFFALIKMEAARYTERAAAVNSSRRAV
tara:strand:+ start:1384 stop:1485 length:102 start_codon:yes stop_codon:yes gene_type:complete